MAQPLRSFAPTYRCKDTFDGFQARRKPVPLEPPLKHEAAALHEAWAHRLDAQLESKSKIFWQRHPEGRGDRLACLFKLAPPKVYQPSFGPLEQIIHDRRTFATEKGSRGLEWYGNGGESDEIKPPCSAPAEYESPVVRPEEALRRPRGLGHGTPGGSGSNPCAKRSLGSMNLRSHPPSTPVNYVEHQCQDLGSTGSTSAESGPFDAFTCVDRHNAGAAKDTLPKEIYDAPSPNTDVAEHSKIAGERYLQAYSHQKWGHDAFGHARELPHVSTLAYQDPTADDKRQEKWKLLSQVDCSPSAIQRVLEASELTTAVLADAKLAVASAYEVSPQLALYGAVKLGSMAQDATESSLAHDLREQALGLLGAAAARSCDMDSQILAEALEAMAAAGVGEQIHLDMILARLLCFLRRDVAFFSSSPSLVVRLAAAVGEIQAVLHLDVKGATAAPASHRFVQQLAAEVCKALPTFDEDCLGYLRPGFITHFCDQAMGKSLLERLADLRVGLTKHTSPHHLVMAKCIEAAVRLQLPLDFIASLPKHVRMYLHALKDTEP